MQTAVIIENETTCLTVPLPEDGVVIWGKGFEVDRVGALPWLHDALVHYWGDLDTHGFAILDKLRAWSPRARSFLMDRETLLVHTDHRFNASADLTARGSKQNTRGVADYVRGAWSETNDEAEQSKTRYLRGGMPTWSAVGATYDDGLGAVTTAVVVKWFTGVEVDGSSLSTMYQLHDGNFELREARRITRCPASRPVDIRPIFGEYYVDPDRVRAVHHLTAGDHGRRDHMAPVRDGCGVPVPATPRTGDEGAAGRPRRPARARRCRP